MASRRCRGGAVGAEETARIEQRAGAFRAQFGPRSEWEGWLVAELAGVSVRLERIAACEVHARAGASHRAATLWDEDQRLAAEQVGARLDRDPARVVATLRQSPHGCDWLIERWAALARLADAAGPRGWTDEQTTLARDLIGTPAASRVGPIGVPIDESGRITAPAPPPAALARQQIAELQAHRERVAAADEAARTLVEVGLSDVTSREVATLRRYERATLRRLVWLKTQMDEAGLRPQAPATAPRPANPGPTARSADPQPPATSVTKSASATEAPTSQPPPEVPTARTGRNEPTAATSSDQTKPSWIKSEAPPAPLVLPPPDRERPDLAKLARHERQNRRTRRSA